MEKQALPHSENHQWQMIIVDLREQSQRIAERKLTTLEASIAMQEWNRHKHGQNLGAVAVFWPDWAPAIKISFCDPQTSAQIPS